MLPGWTPGGDTWRPYAEAVALAGGEPVHLCPDHFGRERAVLLELEGVLFSGGNDVDLALFPNPPELEMGREEAIRRFNLKPEPERDRYELPLFLEALARDLPILGICRGCQVMNVALGGRLILDIPTQVSTQIRHPAYAEGESPSSSHDLRIQAGTALAAILHPQEYTACNSRHHQAVDPADALPAWVRIAAYSPADGLVEAIEITGRRWAIGVQWHPEHPRDPEVRARYAPLFRAFVEACEAS